MRCLAKWRAPLRGALLVGGVALTASLTMLNTLAVGEWTQFGGDAGHSATASTAPSELSAVLWLTGEHPAGTPLVFEGHSGPAVHGGRVFVNALHFEDDINTSNKLVVLDQRTGNVLWETLIDPSTFDFLYSPAVDAGNNVVLLGSGGELYGIDAATGAIHWQTPLSRPIVNAGAVVAPDLDPGRAFITDYDGFGTAGSLYCINTSPFDAQTNPFQPGEIVWQEPIGGSSGNTPAYDAGIVYVASVGDASLAGQMEVGRVFAFDVDASAGSRLLWCTTVGEGFFGGVSIVAGFVYAASFDFNGGQDNSTLVKIRARDGAIQWTADCERTNSIPIIKGDEIYLAGGLAGSGSAPKVQAFRDNGTSAEKIWDTFVDTGGSLVVGGWTHQPVLVDDILYVGKIPITGPFFDPYTDLFLLDTTRTPDDPEFLIECRSGFGSSPAMCDGRLYSLGVDGLHAVAAVGDFCGEGTSGDGTINGRDVQCFVSALLSDSPTPSEVALGDFDGDGGLTLLDVPGFLNALLGP